jgi:hypothetical protein
VLAQRRPGLVPRPADTTTGVSVLGCDDLIGLAAGLDALLAADLEALPRVVIDSRELHQGRVLADTRALVCAEDVAGMRELVFVGQDGLLERVALDERQRTQWRSNLWSARTRRYKRPVSRRPARWPRRKRFAG